MVIYDIDIGKLMHHPANPRKEIGDITELADSIKAQGVMQNLTIIPVHYFTEGWDKARHEQELFRVLDMLKEGHDEDIMFYVLIGNRRLEASKAAGLTKLPCKIVTGLSKDEQIAIMLTENMQRSDLTIQEEAIGFQQMLDLGSDMEEISNISGLSETTVRHRVNIAKLDQELVKNAIDKQINLTDFIELEKISDINKRNEILKNSSDIKWSVKQALDKEEKEKQKNEIISTIRKDFLLEKIPSDAKTWDGTWQRIADYEFGKEVDTSKLIKDELFYQECWNSISIFRRVEKKENPQDEKKARQRKILDELTDKAKQIERDLEKYIEHVIDEGKKNRAAVDGLWIYILENNVSLDHPMVGLTDWIMEIEGIDENEMSEDELDTALKEKAEDMALEHQLLILIYNELAWRSIICGWGDVRDKKACELYGSFIDLIEDLYSGEVISEELQTILDGSHKLYKDLGVA